MTRFRFPIVKGCGLFTRCTLNLESELVTRFQLRFYTQLQIVLVSATSWEIEGIDAKKGFHRLINPSYCSKLIK